MDKKLLQLINQGDTETLDLIHIPESHPLYKLAKTRPLTAEQIFIQHGTEEAVRYMSICNREDKARENQKLQEHIARIIPKSEKHEHEVIRENLRHFLTTEELTGTETIEYELVVSAFAEAIAEPTKENIKALKDNILQFKIKAEPKE